MNAPIVVIGGGVIGLSVAYHLGRAGAADILLLERNRLGSGTSWHAAGIVGPLRASRNLTDLAQYGVDLFRRLEDETGQSTGYRQTGGYWLAGSEPRMAELRRMASIGRMQNLTTQILTRSALSEQVPLLDAGELFGALWVAEDGQVNPVDLCMAYARGARAAGVEIREQSAVHGIIRRGHDVSAVVLGDGQVTAARAVVNCGGLWARALGAMVDVEVPLCAVEHMYIVSEPVAELPDPCPILRDLDSGIYLKGDAGKLVLGMFESNARLWDPDSVSLEAEYLEFPLDWDHAEPMLEAGIRRVPRLAELGISGFINGPESFTPDTRQIMGRAPGLANFYVAAGFNSIGIMSSAGVGRAMAEWILQGRPARELWAVDIQRFLPGDNAPAFLDSRIPESVYNQFDLHWPFKQNRTGRNRQRSVWHEQLVRQGAVFGAPTGWERPLWFATEKPERVFRYSYGPQCWWNAAAREATRLMHSGAVFELSPFSKFLVEGRQVTEHLQRLCTNRLTVPPGRVVYSLWLNEAGGIEGECTLNHLADDRWLIITGAATRVKDYHYLREHLPATVAVRDMTEAFAVLGIMGPASGTLLESVAQTQSHQKAFPFASSKSVVIQDVDVWASRISYVGESGWELMIPAEQACRVLDTITDHMQSLDMGFAGHFCLDACRLEKGHVHWGHDIGPDDNPKSAGLMFAVRMSGSFDFIGKKSLINQSGMDGPVMRRRLYEVCASEPPLMLHDEPIWYGDKCVGHTTSGGIGFRTGKILCMGYVQEVPDTQEEKPWEVEVAGTPYPLRVLERAPYDPDGRRMRA